MKEVTARAVTKDSTQRSVFCQFPVKEEDFGEMSEQDICQWFCENWVQGKETRQAICCYCISANGYKHVHTVFSADTYFRWSAVKKAIPINGDIQATRGSKEQALAYIRKEGEYEEKGETVVCEYSIGEVKSNQGKRNDLDKIGAYINEGLTPNEIMQLDISYRKHDKIIRDAYFAKRSAETPFLRDIVVEWHVGESGTGKTYYAQMLVDTEGEDNVYLVSDYENGGLDRYNGEPILFLDEFRGQIRYSTLLSMLQGYKQQFHARYTNIIGLWKRVIITSVLPPEQVYKNMVSENRDVDTIKQLYRRIAKIVYHYVENGEYKTFEQTMLEYKDYDTMKSKIGKDFVEVSKEQEQYIQEMFMLKVGNE